ncbi:Aste57867_11735 [Aphanomyces stellatus]|uniref:Aste57867_11735 protein n=1 Tax=Aphanomyces stellatus TaxID=120398 RepID=A0A485KTR7_9STRA|nr:hypothetical protein As57867_011691 [Aphanomyces stellatus]VFT88591.1 Aste57867_11735 [Aphanomyces stellatus]
MGKTEQKALLDNIKDDDVLQVMLAKINSANSTATVPSNRDHIFELIKPGPGFQRLDRMVFGALEAWVGKPLETLETPIALAATTEGRVQWLIAKGDIVLSKGAAVDAEAII